MTVRSMPSSFIQAWSRVMVSSRGSPHAKPMSSATSMRGLQAVFRMGGLGLDVMRSIAP